MLLLTSQSQPQSHSGCVVLKLKVMLVSEIQQERRTVITFSTVCNITTNSLQHYQLKKGMFSSFFFVDFLSVVPCFAISFMFINWTHIRLLLSIATWRSILCRIFWWILFGAKPHNKVLVCNGFSLFLLQLFLIPIFINKLLISCRKFGWLNQVRV